MRRLILAFALFTGLGTMSAAGVHVLTTPAIAENCTGGGGN